MMTTALALVLGVAICAVLYVRYSPIDADEWHVDPADVDDPEGRGIRLIGREAPRFPGDADTVLSAFGNIALTEPRVRILDGGVEEGMVTFVARTKTMGYPDMITVKATEEGPQTKLAIVSRARFGKLDLGVNAARLDRWLQDMRLRLGEGG